MIGEGMLFITLNLVAFLLTLVLVLRIGAGRIGQPIFLIGLGFLVSGLIPLILGLMRIFGVFQLMEKRAVEQKPAKSGR